MVQYLGGNPFDVIMGVDSNFDGISNTPQDRPDLVAPIRYTQGSADQKMARYFDPSSFKAPVVNASNLFGNLPRNAMLGPSSYTTNVAAVKNFRISERFSVQVRMEAYNWLNHPNLGGANGNMASGDYTRICKRMATAPCNTGSSSTGRSCFIDSRRRCWFPPLFCPLRRRAG